MDASIDEIVQTWSPKAKAKLLDKIKKALARDPQAWFCVPDVDNDGMPIMYDELIVEQVYNQAGDPIFVHRYIRHDFDCQCLDRKHPGLGPGRVSHGRIFSHGKDCDGHPHGVYGYQHARADQWPPSLAGLWSVWLAISGRGAGKTKSGAEVSLKFSDYTAQTAIIGRRRKDVVDVMVEGPAGLIVACERAGVHYDWLPSRMRFELGNGHLILGYSAEEPDSLRGPEHGAGWLDEPAHMPLIQDVWDNLQFGLRMAGLPGGARVYCTSTPLPTPWLKQLIADPDTVMVRVPTYVNLANLDPGFRRRLLKKYEGTRKGRQELEGEILEDVEGALWQHEWIDDFRSTYSMGSGVWEKIVVAIDPAGTANRKSDETGIVVVGKIGKEFYVLADYSGKFTSAGWGDIALDAYEDWEANEIVAESNFGGDMVKKVITDAAEARGISAKVVVTRAQKSKALRAEPVTAKYEKHLVHHNKPDDVNPLQTLEEEMLTWVPGQGDSPNRVDALVWGILRLMGKAGPAKAGVATGTLPRRGPTGSRNAGLRRAQIYAGGGRRVGR